MTHVELAQEMELCVASPENRRCAELLFESAIRKAILERLLFDAIARKMPADYRLSLLEQIRKIGFDSVPDKAELYRALLDSLVAGDQDETILKLKLEIIEELDEQAAYLQKLKSSLDP